MLDSKDGFVVVDERRREGLNYLFKQLREVLVC